MNTEKLNYTVAIPEEQFDALREISNETGKPIAALVEAAVASWLADELENP
jgi:hypothetical protein